MYSILAFLLTLAELCAVAAAYFLQNQPLFANMLVYGSPLYMLQNAFGTGSVLHEKNLIYLAFAAFHLVKYFVIFQAQRKEEGGVTRNLALVFEAVYLALSAYYLL